LTDAIRYRGQLERRPPTRSDSVRFARGTL